MKNNFNKKHYENISRIFYPNENYKLGFSSRKEMTREVIGKRIVEDNYPVNFKLEKYFKLHKYLQNNNLLDEPKPKSSINPEGIKVIKNYLL